jgi:hypothetical protein
VTAAPAHTRQPILTALPLAITALVLFAVAIGLFHEALATSGQPVNAVVWGSLALASYAAGLLCLVGASHGSGLGLADWKLGSWILLWDCAAFGISSVTWSQSQTGTAAEIAISSVLRALSLVAVALSGWMLGYLVGPGRPARRTSARALKALRVRFGDEVRSPAAPWTLYAIGIAARLATVATTGTFGYIGDPSSAVGTASGYGQLLSLLSLFAPLAVCAAALQVYREHVPFARITLAILFLAELIFGALAGGKQSFVIAILAVAIPISAARGRLPRAAVIASILIFLVIVIPFNQAYRGAARGGSAALAPSAAVHAAPEILRQTLLDQNITQVVPNSTIYLLQRIREIDSVAIIMQRTGSQIPFSSPEFLIEAPVADIVPRAIWPSKPILTTGYQFSQQYYDIPSTTYTSSAITPIGDLYRHGGWIPLIAGMFLLGCGVRLLDDILDIRVSPQSIFLILLISPALIKEESDWVTLLAALPATVLIWLLAVSLTFRRRMA